MRAGLLIATVLVCLGLPVGRAAAIPPFARKYGLSCTTCHVGGPTKLSPFGEAFRDSGYRIPGESESFLREPPLALGSARRSSQDGAWRTTIWPGELPGTAPVGVSGLLGGTATFAKDEGGGTSSLAPRATASLLVGGTLGQHIAFFGVLRGGTSGVALDQLFAVGRSLFERWLGEAAFNIKVGHMSLDLFAVMTNLQRAAILPLPLSLAVGRDGFALGNAADAVEFYGLLGGRLKWVIGAANGIKPLDDLTTRRDFLARLQVKLGGSRLDLRGAQAPDSAANASLGVFTYIGVAVTQPLLPELRFANELYRFGFDARLRLGGLDVLGQVVLGQDSDPLGLGESIRHATWSLGMEYPIFPWLQPLLRFEEAYFDSARLSLRRRLVLGLQLFIRTNVRVRLEGASGLAPTEPHLLLADLFLAM